MTEVRQPHQNEMSLNLRVKNETESGSVVKSWKSQKGLQMIYLMKVQFHGFYEDQTV